jgi:hypothetical protein
MLDFCSYAAIYVEVYLGTPRIEIVISVMLHDKTSAIDA